MTTHAELMQLGGLVLSGSFQGDYALTHKTDCVGVLNPSPTAGCSCGLDAGWTDIVVRAAKLVINYA